MMLSFTPRTSVLCSPRGPTIAEIIACTVSAGPWKGRTVVGGESAIGVAASIYPEGYRLRAHSSKKRDHTTLAGLFLAQIGVRHGHAQRAREGVEPDAPPLPLVELAAASGVGSQRHRDTITGGAGADAVQVRTSKDAAGFFRRKLRALERHEPERRPHLGRRQRISMKLEERDGSPTVAFALLEVALVTVNPQ